MKVPLKELPCERDFPLSEDYVSDLVVDLPMRRALGDEAGPAGHGTSHLNFYLEGDNVFARGTLSGWVELACSRCLEPLKTEIDESLMVTFLPEGQVPSDDEFELEEGDENAEGEDTYAYDGEEIDAELVLRERFLLAIPFAPLCKEDCKGLCSQCGANLNQQECGCSRQVVDPRLASLRDIKV